MSANPKTSNELAFGAAVAILEGTYRLEHGERICLVCGARKSDFANAHAPECPLAAALERAHELSNETLAELKALRGEK